MDVRPVTLEGRFVRLEPIGARHVDDLVEAGSDPGIWRFMSYGVHLERAGIERFVAESSAKTEAGTELVFAVIHRESGKAVGSTRHLDIRREHRGVEVGGTWYAPEFRRTAVNPECKLLMFRHAFETWNAVRVQLKTDLRNTVSQRAIEKLGAVREGILRDHMIMSDGYLRSTVMYSITREEWPAARERLEARLASA